MEANGRLAYRTTDWAFIPPYKGVVRTRTGNELGNLPEGGLFNLKSDLSQTTNIAKQHVKKYKQMESRFLEITKGYFLKGK